MRLLLVLIFSLYSVSCYNFKDEGKQCGAASMPYKCQGDTICLIPGRLFLHRSGFCVRNIELLCTDIECTMGKPCALVDHECRPFGPERSLRCISRQYLAKFGEPCVTAYGGNCMAGLKCERLGLAGFSGEKEMVQLYRLKFLKAPPCHIFLGEYVTFSANITNDLGDKYLKTREDKEKIDLTVQTWTFPEWQIITETSAFYYPKLHNYTGISLKIGLPSSGLKTSSLVICVRANSFVQEGDEYVFLPIYSETLEIFDKKSKQGVESPKQLWNFRFFDLSKQPDLAAPGEKNSSIKIRESCYDVTLGGRAWDAAVSFSTILSALLGYNTSVQVIRVEMKTEYKRLKLNDRNSWDQLVIHDGLDCFVDQETSELLKLILSRKELHLVDLGCGSGLNGIALVSLSAYMEPKKMLRYLLTDLKTVIPTTIKNVELNLRQNQGMLEVAELDWYDINAEKFRQLWHNAFPCSSSVSLDLIIALDVAYNCETHDELLDVWDLMHTNSAHDSQDTSPVVLFGYKPRYPAMEAVVFQKIQNRGWKLNVLGRYLSVHFFLISKKNQ